MKKEIQANNDDMLSEIKIFCTDKIEQSQKKLDNDTKQILHSFNNNVENKFQDFKELVDWEYNREKLTQFEIKVKSELELANSSNQEIKRDMWSQARHLEDKIDFLKKEMTRHDKIASFFLTTISQIIDYFNTINELFRIQAAKGVPQTHIQMI